MADSIERLKSKLVLIITIAMVSQLTAGQEPPALQTVKQQEPQIQGKADTKLERKVRDISTFEERVLRKEGWRPQRLNSEQKEVIDGMRRVESTTLAEYDAFLQLPRTGVFKLFPDLGCQTEFVIRVDNECGNYFVYSSAFSFRDSSYTSRDWHDMLFDRDRIKSDGFFSQGIFVEIGDVAIETIDRRHPSLNFVSDFPVAVDFRSAIEQKKKFENGLFANGYRYVSDIKPKKDTTYAVRIIAYRVPDTLRSLLNRMALWSLFQKISAMKRLDKIVVFRIAGMDENNALTVVWREIMHRKAPKIRFSERQAPKKPWLITL